MHRGLKSAKFEHHRWFHGVKFDRFGCNSRNLNLNTLPLSRINFIAIVTKPIAENCRSLCTLIGKSMRAKVMAVLFRHKNQLEIKPMFFYAANAWTDISKKLKIKFTLTWCRCITTFNNVFLAKKKTINAWKAHVDLITNLNFVKTQLCRWMECI